LFILNARIRFHRCVQLVLAKADNTGPYQHHTVSSRSDVV
jgi:hypothetical protein